MSYSSITFTCLSQDKIGFMYVLFRPTGRLIWQSSLLTIDHPRYWPLVAVYYLWGRSWRHALLFFRLVFVFCAMVEKLDVFVINVYIWMIKAFKLKHYKLSDYGEARINKFLFITIYRKWWFHLCLNIFIHDYVLK